MKSFSRPSYRIANAPSEVKWIYTFFLLFMLIGFLTIGGYEFIRIGFHPQAVSEHYLGASGGEESPAFAKPFSALLETTHFHAFIMGVIYLTLAHLFIATEFRRGFKIFVVILGFLSAFLDLLLPWAIRYGSSAFAPVLLRAWVGDWGGFMAMILASFYDLWIRPKRRGESEEI